MAQRRSGGKAHTRYRAAARALGLALTALSCCRTAMADGTADAVAIQAATDPLIAGQLGAQQSLAVGFSAAQIGNVSSHLQQLHQGFDPCASSGKVGVVNSAAVLPHDGLPTAGTPNALSPTVAVQTTAAPNTIHAAQKRCLNELLFTSHDSGLWYGGHLNYGPGSAGAWEGNSFTTPGVTVGIDHRLASRVIVGAALGRGWSDTVLDATGSHTRADSTQGSLYANYRPVGPMAIDALLGYGDAAMDNRRWIDTDNTWVHGSRHGSTVFASVAMTAPLQYTAFRLEPFLRSDFVQATLNPYSEAGSTPLAMSYGSMYDSSSTLSTGALGMHDFPVAGRVFTPLVGLKYQRLLNDASTANLYFADLGPTNPYSLSLGAPPQMVTTRQVGLRYRDGMGVQGEIGANYPFGNSPFLTPLYTASVHARF